LGYLSRDVWKANAGVVALLVIVVGGSIAGVWLLKGKEGPGSGNSANNLQLTVEGSAPKGVALTLVDGNGRRLLLESDAALPFHRRVPLGGSSLYQLQAQALGGGSGSISCRIAVGRVVSVHRVTGAHACDAGVSYARFGWSPS
jgi:hypothetical protein